MSLWLKLYETYDKISQDPDNNDPRSVDKFLLRDGLTINNAGIDIILDKNGELIDASIIAKDKTRTIFPITPESVRRSGETIAALPLFEKLDYMAKDWSLLVNDSVQLQNHIKKYEAYVDTLGKWVHSTKYPQINAVYSFVSNTDLLHLLLSRFELKDLIGSSSKDQENAEAINAEQAVDVQSSATKEFALIDTQERLQSNILKASNEKNCKKLADIFVRFHVVVDDSTQSALYMNEDLLNEWTNNYKQILGQPSEAVLDYITGTLQDAQTFFPKKIRHQGDGARIISANDKSIRTFGGRFNPRNPQEVSTLGQDAMTKSLYALSWLIGNNNAFSYDNLVILAWNCEFIVEQNALNLIYSGVVQEEDNKSKKSYSFGIDSNKAIQAIAYYGNRGKVLDKLTQEHRVNIIELDGDTKGRISICYYNEIDSTLYYKNLQNWFQTLQWQWWSKDVNGYILKTPNFDELFRLIYAESKEDNKLHKQFYKQILPCVVEGKNLPKFFVQRAFEKVRKPESFRDMSGNFSIKVWRNAINIACAIFNKYYNHGGKYMSLDTNETDRSYLFGRLLALAERVEKTATSNDQYTNAERLFTRFTMRPGQTFTTLNKLLAPYFDKLYSQGKVSLVNYYKKSIADILDKMGTENYESKKAVTDMFILGYYGQRNYRNEKIEQPQEKGDE